MGDVIQLRTNDSLRSLASGLGDPFRDKAAGTSYGLQFIDDYQLAAIYKSNWLGRKIVDIPAMDSIRKGRDWQADQDQIEAIETEEKRLNFWGKLLEVKIKARLWGGAALFIGTGEQDLLEPLNVDLIGKGGIKYLTVLSRRDVTAGEIDQNVLSEFHGRPAYYEVTGASTQAMVRIHPSRLALFIGAPHGDSLLDAGINQGWGDSVIETVYGAMRNADATAANIASLVFEANVDVFSIPNMSSSLSDPAYGKLLIERFSLAAAIKGINRALILDDTEKYERKQVTFATLPEVMQSFLQMAAGAADIPVTRLLGQSPAGMSSTGESDMNNYYDRINSIQTLEMGPALYRLDECLIRSALGSRPPEIYYSWSPLKQMTEKEVAEIGKMTAETVQILSNTGVFMGEELRKVTTNAFVELGVFPGIDQAVAETDAAGGFDLGGEPDTDPVEDPASDNGKAGVQTDETFLDKYSPSQPRNKNGEWSSGGAGGLSDTETSALSHYKNKNYKKLNSELRAGGAASDTVKAIDSAIEKSDGMPKATELYRGIKSKALADQARKDPKSLIGKSFTDNGFVSTTTNNQTARAFAGGAASSTGVVMMIKAPKGTKAVDMDQFGKSVSTKKEAELLLARGSSYKIKKISEWGANIYIEAELD